MDLDWDLHEEIEDVFSKACKNDKTLTASYVNKLLEKYGIDINHDDGLLLEIVCGCMLYDSDEPNYANIKLLLELGADPTLLTVEDHYYPRVIVSLLNFIRIDSIFRSYGYVCNWSTEYLNMNIINKRLGCRCEKCIE